MTLNLSDLSFLRQEANQKIKHCPKGIRRHKRGTVEGFTGGFEEVDSASVFNGQLYRKSPLFVQRCQGGKASLVDFNKKCNLMNSSDLRTLKNTGFSRLNQKKKENPVDVGSWKPSGADRKAKLVVLFLQLAAIDWLL